MPRTLACKVVTAVAAGVLLRFALALEPVWWLVCIAPVPLLLLAFKSSARESRWLVALAATIGASVNAPYYQTVFPGLAISLLLLAAQVALWVTIVLTTRRLVLQYLSWWTALVYPVLWVAVDTLQAALLSDGNWASLGYSLADVQPVVQVAALLGVEGLLFLVTLLPATLAFALATGPLRPAAWSASAVAVAAVSCAVFYGSQRLAAAHDGVPTSVGLVAIDDAIDPRTPAALAARIFAQYSAHVSDLARRGARIVVLPEKVATLAPAAAAQWQRRLSSLAATNQVWLEAGIAVDGEHPQNLAWLFAPDGRLTTSYAKVRLSPPERRRGYAVGNSHATPRIGEHTWGLAICKDLHFATLGRSYGERQISAMLVPAWDFAYRDAWMAARITLLRGVESGYAVVRAAREGLLSVSDPYGRILGQRSSAPLPGAALLVDMPVAAPVATVYKQYGEVLGWLCVVVAGVLFVAPGRRRPAG